MSEKPHIVKSYEEQLQLLKDTIAKMGAGVEKQLENSIQSLVKKDISLAEKSIKDDELIDKYELNIEEQVVNLIALRQPMACLLYTSPSPRDLSTSRMPSSA